jgi:Ca2+-binding RTX toxin-like protein
MSSAYRSAIVEAENFLQSQFSNSVTLNVSFDLSSLPVGDGAENDSLVVGVPYAALVGALGSPSVETTADDRAAVASLPASDPSGGLGFFIPIGMARLLGFAGAPTGNDVTVDLNQNLPWTFGADAVGAIEHELTEAMGRTGGLGVARTTSGIPMWAPMDLFRYSSPGQRDFTGGRDGLPTFFSVDGASLLTEFHNSVNTAGVFDGQDLGDWGFTTGDAFGPGGPGSPGTVTATDLRVMNILGWTPEGARITQVSFSPGAGVVTLGQQVILKLTMSKAVAIAGGTPSITLNDGGIATYVAGSGTAALEFSYTVTTGQNVDSLAAAAVSTNGAAIIDVDGNSASLSLVAVAQNGPLIATPTNSPLFVTLPVDGSFVAAQPNQTVQGGGGATSVTLQGAAAIFLADSGNDLLTLTGVSDTVVGSTGDATINAVAGSAEVRSGTGSLQLNVGDSALTVLGGTGPVTVNGTGFGNILMFSGASPVFFSGGSDASTVVAGAGADTVFANAGGGQFWGGDGGTLFIGGSGVSTAVGGAGSNTLFGGSSGRDLLVAGQGPSTVIGANGNIIAGLGASRDVLVAGAGSESLVGSNGGGGDLMFANAGNVAMFAGNGNDSFVASSGSAQMVGGVTSDIYIFVNGAAGGSDTIWNFTPGQDVVAVFGYGNIVPELLQTAVTSGTSATVVLPDNTHITFGNLAHVTANDLFAG